MAAESKPSRARSKALTILPLFRSVNKQKNLMLNPMTRTDVLRMVKSRTLAPVLPYFTCCHTFRATGITAFLEKRRHDRERSSQSLHTNRRADDSPLTIAGRRRSPATSSSDFDLKRIPYHL
jgi:hypothetical protein